MRGGRKCSAVCGLEDVCEGNDTICFSCLWFSGFWVFSHGLAWLRSLEFGVFTRHTDRIFSFFNVNRYALKKLLFLTDAVILSVSLYIALTVVKMK